MKITNNTQHIIIAGSLSVIKIILRFKWWGTEATDDPHTTAIIKEYKLKVVRLYMTNTFVDGLYNMMSGIFGFSRHTLMVGGNR